MIGALAEALVRLAAVAVLLGPPATQPAAADAENPDDAVQEILVVTASRAEQPLEQVPTHVSVVTAERLRQTPALAIDDALRQVPGFSLFRRNSSIVAHPTTQGVSLRGIGPSGVSRTVVLLDGVPLNDPFGGWVYWGRVPTADLRQVEIVRGGGSTVWGSSALGGVIQLLTNSPASPHLDLQLEAGERETVRGELSWGRSVADRGGFSIRAGAFDTSGYPIVEPQRRGPIDVPATSRHLAFGGRFSWALSNGSRLWGRLERYDEDRGNGTPLTGNDTEIGSGAFGLDHSWTRSRLELRAFYQDQELASRFSAQAADRSSERPALDQFSVDARALGASIQWSRFSEHHTATAGAESRRLDGETHERFFFSGGRFNRQRLAGGDQSLTGVFVSDVWRATDRLAITAGVRYDEWSTRRGIRLETNLADGSVRREEHPADRRETAIDPRLGVVVRLGGGWMLHAGAYRAFRAPSINELYRPFRVRNDITEANALLDPEVLLGAEGGVRFGGRNLRFAGTVFANRLEDPIANVTLALGPGVIAPCGFVPGGGSCRQRQNLDRVRIHGVEIELDVRPGDRWELGFGYLLSDPEVREALAAPQLVGKRLAQVPEHQLSIHGLLRLGARAEASFVTRWVSEQFDDDLNQRRLDGFATLDLQGRYRLGDSWGIFAALENALDETIETARTADGLTSIGAPRQARIGFRYSWRDR